eukprot:jgi/Mesvir1/6028/Mv00772-RA.1
MEAEDACFHTCLSLRPDAIWLSFGHSPARFAAVKDAGITLITMACTVEEALQAARQGADVIVLQGCDAGGHGRQDVGVSIVSLMPTARMALAARDGGGGGCDARAGNAWDARWRASESGPLLGVTSQGGSSHTSHGTEAGPQLTSPIHAGNLAAAPSLAGDGTRPPEEGSTMASALQGRSSHRAGLEEVVLVAAGGIMNGSGLAAALMLGADGVVMGTRFITAHESLAADEYKRRVLAVTDGTAETTPAATWDVLNAQVTGQGFRKGGWVGRALVDSESITRFGKMLPVGAAPREGGGITEADVDWYTKGGYGVRAVWCGASSGLVSEAKAAGEIVHEVSEAAEALLRHPPHFQLL